RLGNEEFGRGSEVPCGLEIRSETELRPASMVPDSAVGGVLAQTGSALRSTRVGGVPHAYAPVPPRDPGAGVFFFLDDLRWRACLDAFALLRAGLSIAF